MQTYEGSRANRPNVRARLSALVGLIGVALAPAAVITSMRSVTVTLLMAVIAIAAGCTVFGFIAIVLAKKAHLRRSVSLGRMGGSRQAAFGRATGIIALALGVSACIALAVYAVLASR
ncbi:MAG: hypothetical protein ABSC51_00545 [Gaiellaceae bacterium]